MAKGTQTPATQQQQDGGAAEAQYLPPRATVVTRPAQGLLVRAAQQKDNNLELWLVQMPQQVTIQSLSGKQLDVPSSAPGAAITDPTVLAGGSKWHVLDETPSVDAVSGMERQVVVVLPTHSVPGQDSKTMMLPVKRHIVLARECGGAGHGDDDEEDEEPPPTVPASKPKASQMHQLLLSTTQHPLQPAGRKRARDDEDGREDDWLGAVDDGYLRAGGQGAPPPATKDLVMQEEPKGAKNKDRKEAKKAKKEAKKEAKQAKKKAKKAKKQQHQAGSKQRDSDSNEGGESDA